MYADKSLTRYLNDLSSRTPAPGGGSVSALMCACAAALMSMVALYSIGKKACRKQEPFLKRAARAARKAGKAFLRYADEDCLAYRSRDMRKALAVPVAVARGAAALITVCPELARKGNPALCSDAAIAAALLEAGFAGSRWNIILNTSGKKGQRTVLKALDARGRMVRLLRQRTEDIVGDLTRR